MLGSPILDLKGMRRMMFQLSGFYYIRVPYFRKLAYPSTAQAFKPKPRALRLSTFGALQKNLGVSEILVLVLFYKSEKKIL